MKNELKSPNIIVTVITSGIIGAVISELIEQVIKLPIDKVIFISLISLIILLAYYTYHWYTEANKILDKANENNKTISRLNHEKQDLQEEKKELQRRIDLLEIRVSIFDISKSPTAMPVEKPIVSDAGPYFTQT